MDVTSILTGGGVGGVIVALAYTGRMILDWRKTPTPDGPQARHENTAVANAQAANAVLTQTLNGLHAENDRLTSRVQHLEESMLVKDTKISELEKRLNDIAQELSDLKDLR